MIRRSQQHASCQGDFWTEFRFPQEIQRSQGEAQSVEWGRAVIFANTKNTYTSLLMSGLPFLFSLLSCCSCHCIDLLGERLEDCRYLIIIPRSFQVRV